MPIRKTTFAPGEYYHIYNRGNSKQVIFHDDEDRLRFIHLLFISNSNRRFITHGYDKKKDLFDYERGSQLVSVGAYCLMSNHFHILLTQGNEGGISKFMQKLATGYSMYYNQKYKRTGSLFEGKFKASHVDSDRYMKYLFSYIHLNPLKLIDPLWVKNIKLGHNQYLEFLKTYQWSSYIDHLDIGNRKWRVILDRQSFPRYFESREGLQKELLDWMSYRESSRGKTS